ncbi:MAG: Flp pilus assembly complex ATPase component TadA [Candidatus Riflebacteria bacterium]|nr:Flp pilus assembly complex ATPase component TadA [Candidatus Riflebacteria bacterium]
MKRIGDTLIETGLITEEQLKKALEQVNKRGIRLGEALIGMGLISESELIKTLSNQLGIPFVSDSELHVDPSLIHEIPYSLAKKFNVIPLSLQNGCLIVATSDPLNISIVDDIENKVKKPVSLVMASSRRISEAIEQFFSGAEAISQTLKQVQESEDESILDRIESDVSDSQNTPVVKFVNQMLQKAVKENASDIHIELDNLDFHIRFRVDGMLKTMFRPKQHLHPLIVSRIKVMSRMDVSEHRLPQDGRMMLKVEGALIDFRTATIPCTSGENIVIRVLNHGNEFSGLTELGYSQDSIEKVSSLIMKNHGLILVAGQTGSGKTTTLYSILRMLNKEEDKIITLEDPVEMNIPMVNQIQVNTKIDLTFANGLRAILRMDPDIIMIGEIRDPETARLAVNASLTGHLVFSTIHTGTAPEVPVRLQEMGVESYLTANTLLAAISQRLLRLNCPTCTEKEKISEIALKKIRIDFPSFRGKGCPACNRTGYRGRTCVEEIMISDSAIKKEILKNSEASVIEEAAKKCGMQTLLENGIQKVKTGLTSLEELVRVI